ncbi:hypothetical protein [Crucivirus-534]|nr:hypothetical protein [Crucivirus-534]
MLASWQMAVRRKVASPPRDALKPLRYSTQKKHEVICTMCSINNLLQRVIFDSWVDFKEQVQTVWVDAQIRAGRSQKSIDGLKPHMIGAAGVSPTLSVMYLREIEGLKVTSVPHTNAASITTGLLSVKCDNSFGHSICVLNGWVIDSIVNPGIYRWTGVIKGYKSIEMLAAWEVEL